MNVKLQPEINFFVGLIDKETESVCQMINQQLVSQSEQCNNLIDPYKSNHGKMIRPRLLLFCGGACGTINQEHIIAASIFQIIHEATLFHDDVIDNGMLRRNMATINNRWGNKAAILVGDLYLSQALKMCSNLSTYFISILADTIIETCKGEISQDLNGSNKVSEEEYLQIIQMKSAEMFSQCCYVGALLAKADMEFCERLKKYGLLTGMAYQILDDVADICGTEKKTGKSNGKDAKNMIQTLPLIHYMKKEDRQLSATLSKEEIARYLHESGSIRYSLAKIKDFCWQAKDQLSPFADTEYKLALQSITELMLHKSESYQ